MTGTQNNTTGQLGHPQPCSSRNRSRTPGGSNPVCSDGIPTETKKTMTGKPNSEQTVRAQLNEIADHWVAHEEYPGDISITDVQELSHTLHEELKGRIETYVADTTFTRREAEVWALSKFADEDYHFVTYDAAALLLSTPDTGFGDTINADEDTADQVVTSDEVEQWYASAEKKVNDAKQTIGAVTFPDRDDVLESPALVWLNQQTVKRLRDQHQADENTLDDVARRALDESEIRRSLEAFVHEYIDARGIDNVAQVAIEKQSLETGVLRFAAHTGLQKDPPDVVTETNAITFHDHRYDFNFYETASGPQELGRITLYASDNIIGMDAVTLEQGLAAADEYMQDLVESDEPLTARTTE